MYFLRYVDGAKQGKRLKPTTPTPEEKKNSKKEYELKRERKFQKQWLINRSWLKYDESKNEMYCTCLSVSFGHCFVCTSFDLRFPNTSVLLQFEMNNKCMC